MSSKLEKHEEFIIQQLLARRSYSQIATDLDALGCKTARTNIHLWAKTRAKKLLSRQQLVNPHFAFAPTAPIPALPAATIPSAPVPRAPVPAPATQKQPDPDAPIQIVRNEAGRVVLPPAVGHRPSHTGAPVKSDIAKVIEALQQEHEEKTGFVYTPAMAKLGAKSGA